MMRRHFVNATQFGHGLLVNDVISVFAGHTFNVLLQLTKNWLT